MYIFKKEIDTENEFDKTSVEVKVVAENLDDLLDSFQRFLLASGFVLKGTIEVVEDDN